MKCNVGPILLKHKRVTNYGNTNEKCDVIDSLQTNVAYCKRLASTKLLLVSVPTGNITYITSVYKLCLDITWMAIFVYAM